MTNQFEFRDQGGRLGISGKLLAGDDWSLTGALNSDIPGVGQITTQRTLIVNPGLFASFNYRPKGSRWSLYALLAPRVFIYRDRMAMSDQDVLSNLAPGMKPEVMLYANPSINYALDDKSGLRLGMVVDYRKQAGTAGLNRWFAPVDFGYTYTLNKYLSIYPFVAVSTPMDNALREQLTRSGTPAAWYDTTRVGMWINGTLL